MSQEKLCPHCNIWTQWNGHIEDKCHHCSEFLKLAEKIDIAEKEERQRKLEYNFKEKFPLKIKEGDNILVKGTKRVLYGVYFVFMSIMITFLWIVFWLAS